MFRAETMRDHSIEVHQLISSLSRLSGIKSRIRLYVKPFYVHPSTWLRLRDKETRNSIRTHVGRMKDAIQCMVFPTSTHSDMCKACTILTNSCDELYQMADVLGYVELSRVAESLSVRADRISELVFNFPN